jgi:hypothetical protein
MFEGSYLRQVMEGQIYSTDVMGGTGMTRLASNDPVYLIYSLLRTVVHSVPAAARITQKTYCSE